MILEDLLLTSRFKLTDRWNNGRRSTLSYEAVTFSILLYFAIHYTGLRGTIIKNNAYTNSTPLNTILFYL